MVRVRSSLWSVVAVGAAAAVACGGESSSGLGAASGPDASSAGGSSAGGKAGTGGSAAGTGGAVQTGGAGGGTAAGGAVASGGAAAADGGGCAPPANPADTAVCLTLLPEDIKAQADPALDKKGLLIVDVFDTPNPPAKNAGQVALAEVVDPPNPANEVSLDQIKPVRLVGRMPGTVYIRAIFVDNAKVLTAGGAITFGTWFGGINLADGLQDPEPVLAVPVKIGQGNAVSLPLTALRKLKVTVHAAIPFVGDGQGPLGVVAVNGADPSRKPQIFGLATDKCADLRAGDVTVTGFVFGPGPYWVTGMLKDLGGPGEFPPGSLAAISVVGGQVTIPRQVTIAARDYSPTGTIDLGYAVPRAADAGAVPPNSCVDLAAGATDGGVDGAVP